MTNLERLALLGDKEAQKECTEKGILLPCPHCSGNGKVSFKDHRFVGANMRGDKKLVYRVQVICNKCRSRGKPVFTDPLINPNPYLTKWGNCYCEKSEVCKAETERFLPYVMAAVSDWNTRQAPPIGRCEDCQYQDDCRKQITFDKRDYILEQNVSEFFKLSYCSYFKPRCEE